MGSGPERRLRELIRAWKLFSKVPGDFFKGLEPGRGDRAQDDFIAMLFDKHFRPGEPEGLGQPHGLAASVLEYFSGVHLYIL